MDEVTQPFPMYPLETVENDIRKEVKQFDKDLLPKLPKLPKEVGGQVDLMLGRNYMKDFPLEVKRMKSGLTIYDSMFLSHDGTTGVVLGPHPEFTKIERSCHFSSDRSCFLTEATRCCLDFVHDQITVPTLGEERSFVDSDLVQFFPRESCARDELASSNSHLMSAFPGKVGNDCEFADPVALGSGVVINDDGETFVARAPKCLKCFQILEETGTNISYRCPDCRNCMGCKRGALVEETSIKIEQGQKLIDNSVVLDPEKNVCVAHLPFLQDPDLTLVDNVSSARKVYDKVVRTLAKNSSDRNEVLEAEGKLQKLGYVDWLENLSEDDQKIILDAPVRYTLPWRVVYSDSISTAVRPVFDGTMQPSEGSAINDILAKGANNMNNLVEILLRWFVKKFAYHTDISKCYNGVKLHKSHWRYQLYLFEKNLDPKLKPKFKVIKTCIYGLRPSGYQAERALRMIAETYFAEYPMAYDIIHRDMYVDDCLSGENILEERVKATEQLQDCLAKGGFTLKGYTFSGDAPDLKLSKDGKSINATGLKWFPEGDFLMFNIGEISTARRVRGRKVKSKIKDMTLTMRDCVSIVAGIFDPTGRIAPIIASFKLDISTLHRSGLKWDDEIPENLRSVWESNIEMMEEIRSLRYQRALVPHDAKNLDIVTIDTGDASASLICAAIYVRFERSDGTFSCQLIFARTKVLPEGTTTPRGELMASVLNAATGFTVKRALGDLHKKCYKLTDSTVALSWISNEDAMLKTWTRTRAIECRRLCPSSNWYYVDSDNMIADLGTRRGVKVADVAAGSSWINGFEWMSGSEEEFPIKTYDQIKLNQQDVAEVAKETLVTQTYHSCMAAVVDNYTDRQIKLRSFHSQYLIDPNRFRFRKVVRIFALVLSFIWKISKKVIKVRENKIFHHVPPGGLPDVLKCNDDRYIVTTSLLKKDPGCSLSGGVIEMSDSMLNASMYYFSLRASEEMKMFNDRKKYVNISREIDGVLYYSGRILEDYKFGGYPDLCGVVIDLCSTKFCVPVMDQYSPVAISIALEIHWYHPDVGHKGIETIHRQTLCVAHIVGGRLLAGWVKDGCKKCRALNKKSIDVAMGPIQEANLCIAPPFFACQIDIFGPYKTYSFANKRATLKIWFIIFCCTTTGSTDIRAMEDYSTDSVVFAFIRFSCRYGYPRYVLPDAGSQLLKSCEDMRYSFSDTKNRLRLEFGVDYSPCPVGAHYVHGKVERKIKEVKKSVNIHVQNERLSLLQWVTLMHQISNSINNLPIGLKSATRDLENLDLITPNRLILGRNNDRTPNAPLTICNDHKRMIENNALIFQAWFKAWIVSYVPTLIDRPKWHKSGREVKVGDIVLFLKNEKEFDQQYQYGRIAEVYRGKDELIRKVDVQYKNPNEDTFRNTKRGVRDLVLISPIDELDIYEVLDHLI